MCEGFTFFLSSLARDPAFLILAIPVGRNYISTWLLFAFLQWQWSWASSHVLFSHLCIFLEKLLFVYPAHVYSGCLSFYFWVVFYVLWIQVPYQNMNCKNFLPILPVLLFYFMDSIFWGTKFLNFGEVQFISNSLCCFCFCCDIQLTQGWASSQGFAALVLTLRALIHLQLYFVYVWYIYEGSKFIH